MKKTLEAYQRKMGKGYEPVHMIKSKWLTFTEETVSEYSDKEKIERRKDIRIRG